MTAIWHEMLVEENFERAAQRLHECLLKAQEVSPNAPRKLYVRIQGHRNLAGGYDADAFELINEFALGFLGDYFQEISTPFYEVVNKKGQRNDIPPVLQINSGDHEFDYAGLSIRRQEERETSRKSPPTVGTIAEYLGMHEPMCLICHSREVERAHALPKKLGGSFDVRNFALLCKAHHEQAPDVADAEAFWAWIDYQCVEHWRALTSSPRDSSASVSMAGVAGSHFSQVCALLTAQYGWTENDFKSAPWHLLMEEFHEVKKRATSTHFGIDQKPSTEAWAYDIARRRLDSIERHEEGAD